MKREDICTIVKDVASQFGYEYRDHLGLIYLTKEDDEIEVCCCHELPQSINLFSRVFDFDPSVATTVISIPALFLIYCPRTPPKA